MKLQAKRWQDFCPNICITSGVTLQAKERWTQWDKTCDIIILGYNFPKSVSYHSIFLKIRNRYFHSTPLSGSFCFIAFLQVCEILAEIFGAQLIAQLPDLGEKFIFMLPQKMSFWHFWWMSGFWENCVMFSHSKILKCNIILSVSISHLPLSQN